MGSLRSGLPRQINLLTQEISTEVGRDNILQLLLFLHSVGGKPRATPCFTILIKYIKFCTA